MAKQNSLAETLEAVQESSRVKVRRLQLDLLNRLYSKMNSCSPRCFACAEEVVLLIGRPDPDLVRGTDHVDYINSEAASAIFDLPVRLERTAKEKIAYYETLVASFLNIGSPFIFWLLLVHILSPVAPSPSLTFPW